MKYIGTLFVALFIIFNSQAQAPKVWTSGEIYNSIEKLNFLGSVLYVAAHPDDENTRLISYFSNHVKARTSYLSLTRGDGGQNLIGPEIKELLGVIRTNELLAARRIDGGEQMFSRANDFGYSKNAEETLDFWDRDKVLSDVVWAIRKFRPDIIINRFQHDNSGSTHGHHTSSAILSHEAFDLTGKKSSFPEQLRYVKPFQARRLFFNTGWWFYGSRENFEKADKSDMVTMDIGTYFPVLGKSNLEIAAESRSQHKCQGMGNTGSRGSSFEYIKLLKGDMPKGSTDPFIGINTTWSRVPGGENITYDINTILENFDFKNPSNSIPALLKVKDKIELLPAHHWKDIKLEEIDQIIKATLGLYLEVYTREHRSCPGETVEISAEITNQSTIPIKLNSIHIESASYDTVFSSTIQPNKKITFRENILLNDNLKYTAPYWLTQKGTLGMYNVEDQTLIGQPLTEPQLKARFSIDVLDYNINYTHDIQYKFNSPEDGPVYRPFEITPPASASIEDKVNIFKGMAPKEVGVVVTAAKDSTEGTIHLELPEGWNIDSNDLPFSIEEKGESKTYIFNVTPPSEPQEITASVKLIIGSESYNHDLIEIDYAHIPFQSVLIPADAKFVYMDLHTIGKNIGYIEGAGDDIPASLTQVGYNVSMIDPESISSNSLVSYDAVIVGIRAYNKWEEMKFAQKHILDYVKNGGTLIIQFNTTRGLKSEQLGPYPLELSRARVSKEDAPIRILAPNHRVMNYPNSISDDDFENWVQERGLYFPGKWDDKYTAILSSNDPGEDPRNGGLLVTTYGEGWYVYTGYSWFRQLPAGVPGAFRIFANLIALGNTPRP